MGLEATAYAERRLPRTVFSSAAFNVFVSAVMSFSEKLTTAVEADHRHSLGNGFGPAHDDAGNYIIKSQCSLASRSSATVIDLLMGGR